MYKKTTFAISIFILLSLFMQGCGSKIQAGDSAQPKPTASPSQISEAFYAWYLDYLGDPASNTFRSPLADRAYRDSKYLTPSFIEHVDEILASFEGRGGYDPFLCAQDIPEEIKADSIFWQGEEASVLMRTSFPNHYMTVDLEKNGDAWQIGNIVCPFSAVGTAKAFYTWYLGYIGDPASEEMHNPLVDKAYQSCGFLSTRFIQELDDFTADGIPADPILMAQAVPHGFTVDPGAEEDTAIVHLQFGTETIHSLKVGMISELGIWRIDSIQKAE